MIFLPIMRGNLRSVSAIALGVSPSRTQEFCKALRFRKQGSITLHVLKVLLEHVLRKASQKLEWNQNDQLQGAKFSNQPDSCNQTTLVTRRWSNLTVTISSNTSVAGSSPPGWAPQRKGAVQSEGDLGMKVQNAWHVWLP